MAYRTIGTSHYQNVEKIREYQPCKRTISTSSGTYTLQFPYIIFYDINGSLHVAFAKHPIKSRKDRVYIPTVGNVYPGWRICGCSSGNLVKDIEIFWGSQFTTDGLSSIVSRAYGSYYEWSQLGLSAVLKRLSKVESKPFLRFLNDADCNGDWLAFNWGQKMALPSHLKLNLKAKYPKPIDLSAYGISIPKAPKTPRKAAKKKPAKKVVKKKTVKKTKNKTAGLPRKKAVKIRK